MERGEVLMSKYTIEVRYICEHFSGLSESVGYDDVEQVIKNCLPKVFDLTFLYLMKVIGQFLKLKSYVTTTQEK